METGAPAGPAGGPASGAVQNLLASVVDFCRRRAVLVVLAGLVLAGLSGLAAATRLGVTTDTDVMFAPSLPWRQAKVAFDKAFPQFQGLLVAVIDAHEPEEAEATAAALADKLAADTVHFHSVRRPDASPYLRKEGLLFLGEKELQALMDQTIDAQPFLGQLVADPSARGLFSALSLLGIGVEKAQADITPYGDALRGFHDAMASALAGKGEPLSWQRLLGGKTAELGGPYKFVLVQPKLDFGSLEPGGAATAAIRAAAADLPFVKAGDARVRITGQVALADEEFATVAQGAVTGLVISVVLITAWLFLALHSWRLIVPALATLILGLLLTLLFASLAVGTLNLVSVAFAILFVGIAVDFAIQFSVRYREARHHFVDLGRALMETGRRSGTQILVAAAATAAGFLAFVPTDFRGVAELGLIAGVGMLIAFACTLTFLPAMIALFRPRAEAAEIGFRWAAPLDPLVVRHRTPILAAFAALALVGLACAPRLTFDADPLHTKDPTTEAMRTLQDLIANPVTNPYTIDILAPDEAAASALAEKLKALPTVDGVLTLASFVPKDQPPKLAIIADANTILAPTLAPHDAAAPVTASQIRLAARTAADNIEPALAKLPKDSPLVAIAVDLRAVQAAPDATVMALNAALTRFLPDELDRLRTALSAEPVTIANVPESIARDWALPDGRVRLQVTAKADYRGSAGLRAFVQDVQTVAPNAGGSAVTIVATSRTIVGAFRTAAIAAFVAIAVILFVALRRVLDVGLVLAPLLMSALLTLLAVVVAGLPINFANIIALPLLLGVGVSFNIYFVMNWRAGAAAPLGSATARAILFSALTTGTAFGSLALSHHPGTASMGVLLLISLACTLAASLIFIPALLACLRPAPPA
ncbi:MAG: MMPL family transporter [Proteobacteria bacterium]|nr:MMPL family transporter [Pseudomonadota bacterium]